jgi:hypothetical protein
MSPIAGQKHINCPLAAIRCVFSGVSYKVQHGSDREFREQLKEKEASREILWERTFQQGSPLEVEPSEAEMERLRALG